MNIELTNEQRRCLGMELIPVGWEKVELGAGTTLFFEGDTIRKKIHFGETFYHEYSLNVETVQGRTMIVPKTAKGKLTKLTVATLEKRSGYGVYLYFSKGHVTLANYTTQITYYSSRLAGLEPMDMEQLNIWLKQWVEETDEDQMRKIQDFADAGRRHCKFTEGDYFRFRVDRKLYGYGRILLDVMAQRKQGIQGWNILMGRPLVIQICHVLTENAELSVGDLSRLMTCPSQYIMDNKCFYGEYEIIGHGPLVENLDYPIMYGRSISAIDRDKIMFQQGPVYKEIPLDGEEVVPGSFRNNGIGFGLHIDKNVLEACIMSGSNDPFWNRELYYLHEDLRNPINQEALQKVREQFGIGF